MHRLSTEWGRQLKTSLAANLTVIQYLTFPLFRIHAHAHTHTHTHTHTYTRACQELDALYPPPSQQDGSSRLVEILREENSSLKKELESYYQRVRRLQKVSTTSPSIRCCYTYILHVAEEDKTPALP